MQVVHVYSNNLTIFDDALKGTSCVINGSRSIDFMAKGIYKFNARDTLGLIVFSPKLTKAVVQFIYKFDNYFSLNAKPIVIICDNVASLRASNIFSNVQCPLYFVESLDGTISDTDIESIFSTLLICSNSCYDFNSFKGTTMSVSPMQDVSTGIDTSTSYMQVLKELREWDFN